MNAIFLQAVYYGIVLIMGVLCVSALFKGFFFKYIKVRTSMGKNVIVKVRSINRDYFAVGWIEENYLKYKDNKEIKRITIKNKNCFYRALSVVWVDVDSEKNAICNADYTTVSGYDAVKFEDLYNRALYKPAIRSNKETVVFILLIIIIFLAGASAYLGYAGYSGIGNLTQYVISALSRGTVTGGGAI